MATNWAVDYPSWLRNVGAQIAGGGGGAGPAPTPTPTPTPVTPTPTPTPTPTTPTYPWGWTGGGGGGGGEKNAWTGEIPAWGAIPWTGWEQTPWANVPKDKSQEAQAWFNVMLPWLQAQQQAGQWGQEFDWQKVMDEWQKGFEEQQFQHQVGTDVWSQGFQEQQLAQQKALEEANRLANIEMNTMQTFGRRWKPNTRWM